MGFKKLKTYNEENWGGMFLLRNDGDFADVIFMYQNEDDVLIASTHYIKSSDFNGYVHCCGKGCPACAKGIRVQTKLFIPLYNINAGEIQFWDRGNRFQNQLMSDVFANYPNPCEYVFRITRHGAAGSIDTTYEIVAVGRNTYKSYADILVEQNAKMPDYYETVCKDMDIATLSSHLSTQGTNTSSATSGDMPTYQVTPRTTAGFSRPGTPVGQPTPVSYTVPGSTSGECVPSVGTVTADDTPPFDMSDDDIDDDVVF